MPRQREPRQQHYGHDRVDDHAGEYGHERHTRPYGEESHEADSTPPNGPYDHVADANDVVNGSAPSPTPDLMSLMNPHGAT